jgi:Zn-dependent protease with chaperone function
MRIVCASCNQPFESPDNAGGPMANPTCPNCGIIAVRPAAPVAPKPSPAAPARPQSSIDPATLRDAKEGTAFTWLVIFSILGWLLILAWTVASFGVALLIIGFFLLMRRILGMFAAAYIKTNAVEVGPRQFPGIYDVANAFSARIGQPMPTIYVMQASVWNAFATKIAGRRFVVLYSGAVDAILLKGSMTQLAWLVGHELGHHFAGHLNFWRHATATLGSWFIWVGLWYRRRCELTCDRYGLACAGSLAESLRAVCNMAVGAQLAPAVSVEEAIAQWNKYRSEFFVGYRTLYSTHPHTLARLEELQSSARDLGIS